MWKDFLGNRTSSIVALASGHHVKVGNIEHMVDNSAMVELINPETNMEVCSMRYAADGRVHNDVLDVFPNCDDWHIHHDLSKFVRFVGFKVGQDVLLENGEVTTVTHVRLHTPSSWLVAFAKESLSILTYGVGGVCAQSSTLNIVGVAK